MELPEIEWVRNDYDLVLCSGCDIYLGCKGCSWMVEITVLPDELDGRLVDFSHDNLRYHLLISITSL